MAIILGTKYAPKVQERFSIGSKTDAYAGKDYDFTGVDTIKVYKIDTVSMTDYTRSGTMRYGSLTELGDTVQTMQVTKDRAFTFSIDYGNAKQQFNIKQANASLKRQIDEVVTPEIDNYRLTAWAKGNGLSGGFAVTTASDGALTAANIVEKIFTAAAQMSDDKVPVNNRVLFIPELTYLKFQLASIVMGGADKATEENLRRGYKGTIDGMDVVTVPSSIWPTKAGTGLAKDINFIVKYKGATVDPVQLRDYTIHKHPMGVRGDVVEGSIIYDSFVLDTRAKGIYLSLAAT